MNYFIYKIYNQKNFVFVSKTLQIQGLITIGFLLFVLITSNPFERMMLFQSDRFGPNPILQDPALAIHPPVLYLGYIGFSMVLSLALAGLITNSIMQKIFYL